MKCEQFNQKLWEGKDMSVYYSSNHISLRCFYVNELKVKQAYTENVDYKIYWYILHCHATSK